MSRRLPMLPLLATLLTLCWPAAARGEWKSVQQVTLGTAQVLEQGAIHFGIVAPIAYGASSRLTVQSHPILDLLLVPNLAFRYRLFDQTHYVISATGSFKRSFGQVAATTTQVGALAPGELLGGGIATWYPNNSWAVTGGVVYAGQFDERINNRYVNLSHGISVSAQLHWLIQPGDLLQVSMLQRYGISAGALDRPEITLGWAHGFQRWLAGAHLLMSLTLNDAAGYDIPGLSWLQRWPLLPYVDLWWRL
ncbi:MAG: hypothetical protein HY902_12165 [Deltaproteobacteria bacterium]|nr:hypothetical protein [Deltaproteobacteria bacterium]